jgi:DNA-binding LacI/PurR family transcriptional regulator
MTSTAALAESLGLSRWAVSRALNGRDGVSQETIARVREAAERHGFQPNEAARTLRAGAADVVGVCLPDPNAFFLGGKLGTLQARLQARGHQIMLQITDGSTASEESALARFVSLRCPRLVLFASCLDPEHRIFRLLAERNVRLVHMDPLIAQRGPRVVADRALAMVLAFEHLHALGHRRFCLAGLLHGESAYASRRKAGIHRAARQMGLNLAKDFLNLEVSSQESELCQGRELAKAYLALGPRRPRAILALNDRIAFAMMSTLAEQGLRAPRDFLIVGYDATELSAFCCPPLTTIDPRHDELVEQAVNLLFDPSRSERIRIRPVLIPRTSTGS